MSVAELRELVDQLQLARHGSPELDHLVGAAVLRAPDGEHGCRWSRDIDQAISLLPTSYNFSLGHRDGVFWAWVQPNDRWEPNEYEARHDHPGGSGLVVAHTSALAVACAAVILQGRQGR